MQSRFRQRAFACPALNALILILFIGWANPLAAQESSQPRPHTLTGDIRYHRNFHSRFLANDRDVVVYLPPGYDANSQRRYPVLYMHDGQNLFDGATSFIPGMEWHLDETAQALITSGAIEPLIIVGVYNSKDRIDEYTPVKDSKYKLGGKADLYGRLLVEELKPFIDSNYRTLKGPQNTGLGGSSLGGLVSLYLGLKYPQTFGKLAVISPSVWFGNRIIVRDVLAVQVKPRLRVWLDTGTSEGGDEAEAAQTTADAELLRDALIAKGWRPNVDLTYFEAQGAKHNEEAWAQRVGPLLKFLFPRK